MFNVMLVDDNDVMRMYIRRFKLWNGESGFRIQCEAANGLEALEKLEYEHIDLIITDIRMPIVDGLELLQKVAERYPDICIVFLSEFSEFEYARKGLVFGAFDYMVKPLKEEDLRALLARVKNHLDEKVEKRKENLSFAEYDLTEIIVKVQKGDYSSLEDIENLVNSLSIVAGDDERQRVLAVKYFMERVQQAILDKYLWTQDFIGLEQILKDFSTKNIQIEGLLETLKGSISKILDFLNSFMFMNVENSVVSKVCNYVLNERDENITLQGLSQKLFLNSSHISSTFREKTGITISEYFLRIKMERAKKLLLQPNAKNYKVAEKLGYKDIEYFSRQFKKYTGISPTQFKSSYYFQM